METFPSPYFTIGEDYPDGANKVKFGRGWEFAAEPLGPDQVEFILRFRGMWFFTDAEGDVDLTRDVAINMAVLDAFYRTHRTYKPFLFNHPSRGQVTVRFKDPLRWRLVEDGKGLVEAFEIKLMLLP